MFSCLPGMVGHDINSISPNIQFTVEIEKDRSLPFLDVQITRNANNTLIYSMTLITLATTRLLLPRACLIEWILI